MEQSNRQLVGSLCVTVAKIKMDCFTVNLTTGLPSGKEKYWSVLFLHDDTYRFP